MARDKNGWIKLHSSVLDKNFTHVEFKIWVGLLILANSLQHNRPGLIDLSLREISSRLHVSVPAVHDARVKFLRAGRIRTVSIPTKTKPILGIQIENFSFYQGREIVQHSEYANGESSTQRKKKVQRSEQKVQHSERKVQHSEYSHSQNTLPKKHKETKEDIYSNNVIDFRFLNGLAKGLLTELTEGCSTVKQLAKYPTDWQGKAVDQAIKGYSPVTWAIVFGILKNWAADGKPTLTPLRLRRNKNVEYAERLERQKL